MTTAPPAKFDVFLSHNSRDKEVVAMTPKRKSERPRWLRWSAATALSVLGVVATLATWFWPRPANPVPGPEKPALYAVRVQVLDPQGRAVAGAKVRTSAGNEPQQLPDGWWEIEIPAAKVPVDGRVTLWAEHPEWLGSRAELTLGRDPNPRAELHLREPESRLRGQVVDGRNRALAGVRIFRQDGGPEEARTDGEGRFELKLGVPPETRVGLRAEYRDTAEETFCYAGRDGCSIVLDSAKH